MKNTILASVLVVVLAIVLVVAIIAFIAYEDNGEKDSDGDGCPDSEDAFPNDPNEQKDSDGDGVGNNADALPYDPTQWADRDGDGYGDNPLGINPDAFPDDPTEWKDSDGDGVGDNSDAFPDDPDAWETPRVSMDWREDPEVHGKYSGNVIAISGASAIYICDVKVIVEHGGQIASENLEVLAGGGMLIIDDTPIHQFCLSFENNDPQDKLTAADQFVVTGACNGDTITLLWCPNNGQMSSTTLE